MGLDSDIIKAAQRTIRGRVAIRYRERLMSIGWLDSTETHWADMDGTTIRLSSRRAFDDDTLYWTLLHEELHDIVKRIGRSGTYLDLSEEREHRVMRNLDRRLVE